MQRDRLERTVVEPRRCQRAVEEQLGVIFDSDVFALAVLVVDHVEMPQLFAVACHVAGSEDLRMQVGAIEPLLDRQFVIVALLLKRSDVIGIDRDGRHHVVGDLEVAVLFPFEIVFVEAEIDKRIAVRGLGVDPQSEMVFWLLVVGETPAGQFMRCRAFGGVDRRGVRKALFQHDRAGADHPAMGGAWGERGVCAVGVSGAGHSSRSSFAIAIKAKPRRLAVDAERCPSAIGVPSTPSKPSVSNSTSPLSARVA